MRWNINEFPKDPSEVEVFCSRLDPSRHVSRVLIFEVSTSRSYQEVSTSFHHLFLVVPCYLETVMLSTRQEVRELWECTHLQQRQCRSVELRIADESERTVPWVVEWKHLE